jgi:hypothetical protein
METTSNQVTAEKSGPTLQLNRSLLPIDEYAAREGLSRGIVEECGKLGILQIRKYRGKAFVVDVPVSPYRCGGEVGEEATKPVDGTDPLEKISELGQEVLSKAPTLQKDRRAGAGEISETTEADVKASTDAIKAGTISALVEKMCDEASQITGKPIKPLEDESNQVKEISGPASVVEPVGYETMAESSQVSDYPIEARKRFQLVSAISCKASAIISKLTGAVSGRFAKRRAKAESYQIAQDYGIQSDLPAEGRFYQELQNAEAAARAGSKRTWQVVTLFSIVFLFAALAVNIWFYRDRQVQLGKVDMAQANTQIVYKDFIRTDKQVKALENELAGSKGEIERIQNELDGSRAEIETVRNELADARASLKTIQRRHAQAVGRVNEEMQKLIAWLRESNKSTQTSSDSVTSGQ